MRRSVILALLTLLSSIGFSQQIAYSISGHLKGLAVSAVILEISQADFSIKYDTAIAKDGHFKFVGTISEPRLSYLRYDPMKAGITVYLENGAIEVKGTVDMPDRIAVNGSGLNDSYASLKMEKGRINDMKKILSDKYKQVKEKKDINGIELIKKALDSLSAEGLMVSKHFILTNRFSFVSLYELRALLTSLEYFDLDSLFTQLDQSLHKSELGSEIAGRIEIKKRTRIGEIAMEFTQPDMSGNPVHLSDFKNKYVLLDFWASICYPCRVENKNLVNLYTQYRDKGFEILGVSFDSNAIAWKAAIEEDGLSWTNVCDLKGMKNAVLTIYGVTSFPTNYLINPEGIIIGRNLKGEALKTELEKLFK